MRRSLALALTLSLGGSAACSKGIAPIGDGEPTNPTEEVPSGFCTDREDGTYCDDGLAVTCAGGETDAAEACADSCVEDVGCVDGATLVLDVPGSDPAILETTGVVVEMYPPGADFAEQRLRMRAIRYTSGADLAIALTGPFAILDDAGAPVSTLPAGQGTVWISATGAGTGALTVSGGAARTIPLTARLSPGLSGRALDGYPWFEPVTTFVAGEPMEVAIDPTRFADRVGMPFDLAVVPHRTLAEWAANPDLGDAVLTGSGTLVAGSVQDNRWVLGELPSGPEPTRGWDVVADFDRDGLFGPGDLLDGGEAPGAASAIDFVTPGPFATVSFEYSTGVWTTMKVYTPEDPASVGGLMPIVIISHGNGHDYTWYDYLGEFLASWGYVVVSHTNNTGPGIDTASTTTLQNTEVFLRDIAILGGGMLDGYVDGHQIAWIGHSRGGEGVVHAYNKLVKDIGVQPTTFDENDVVVISSIAPTMFQGTVETNPHDRDYQILSGSRDGDVTGGVAFGDVTQYWAIFQKGTGEHLVTYVHGADHNDFNCCGSDDATWAKGPGEIIGRQAAQKIAKSYYLALLDHYVRGDEHMFDFLWRMPDNFAPVQTPAILNTTYAPGDLDPHYVIDDFQVNPEPELSSSGGTVETDVADLVEGALDDKNTTFDWMANDPMNGMTWSNDDPNPERGIVLTGEVGQYVTWNIAGDHQDWTADRYLSFRACQGTRHPLTTGETSFEVTLTDASGVSSTIDFGVYGQLTKPYARTDDGNKGAGWANEFSTVRIRLTDFEADGSGIDLSAITAVTLTFGGPEQAGQRIGLDHLILEP